MSEQKVEKFGAGDDPGKWEYVESKKKPKCF